MELNRSILIVDDDDALRDTVALMLEREGFKVSEAADGQQGLTQSLVTRPSLVLVDLRLPGLSGAELCRRLRSSGFDRPIIILSAVGDEVDKVLLLEMGADDYVVKPFGMRELLARVRAVLRRAMPVVSGTMRFADVEVDAARRLVLKAGEEVKLTPLEFRLLTYFLHHPDEALTRDGILNAVWGYSEDTTTRTVDSHVVRLRQKLEPDPVRPRHILTLHGVGYRFLP
jgi:DNA-binding response OmpR family regulator